MRDKYDVVVVGSGPAGATYARIIKELRPGARLLMVEAGPVVSNPPGRHVRTIKDPRERIAAQFASQGPEAHPADYEERVARALSPSRGRSSELLARPGTWLLNPQAQKDDSTGFPAAALSSNVGGMGAHWSGACPFPGEGEISEDLNPPAFADAVTEAIWILQVTQRAFDGAPLGAEVRNLLGAHYDHGRPAGRAVQAMPLAMDVRSNGERYWTGPGVMLGDLLTAGHEHFELRANTVAKRILTSKGKAHGVLLHDRGENRDYEVGADYVVVAADSLRSPQLLSASGIRPAALGHYLNEHTMTTSTIQLHPSLRAATEGAGKTSEGAVDLLAGVSWVPYYDKTFPFHGQVTQWDASPIPVDENFEVWPGSVVECSVFMGKADVRYEDYLEFDDNELDYFGMPSIKIHYGFTENDHAHLAQAVEEAKRMGSLLGEPINGLEPAVMPHGASLHYQGTTRIGTDDTTSVLDPSMRVWGSDNVYVGGNGTIATPAACNPTLTNVALSVLGARDLAARL
ncbi:GMC oxidoreductase [Paenarthrobacter sp. TYUT067]|uniref:GMC oxidoreductase n=1 Tax=Paenarthrobacter sp. TYUT067 TaxID=2926245 RepID=UPI00202DE582|nr:GMC oxidoreductase [Paenarthrobacter sp. TYUT067]MCM0614980.1 GMC oxidoreductase [Paenarthrobacter sp. TYUT067]